MGQSVVYVGNFEPSHSTENHVRRSLVSLGLEVVPAQENEVTLRQLDGLVRNADLLLYTRTWGLRGGDAARWITSLPIPTASYHLDLYAGLARGKNLAADAFWRTGHVFTPDGGSEAFFRGHGVRHHYVKPGVFGEECRLLPADPAYTADVCFVGSYDYHPEWPYRQRLVNFLRDRYGARFVKHGHPESCVRGDDLNRLYASVKVVVGDSLCPGFDHPHYWSDRVYETLGRGGFMIHPYVQGLEEEFRDRQHLAFYTYGDFRALGRLIDHYLEHEDERESIRRAGHERVKAQCTYVHRVRQVLGLLGAEHSAFREWAAPGLTA
jgi:hypothetical protein